LLVDLTITRTGQVVDAEVVRSSGNRVLDDKALAIARLSGPFDRFPPAMGPWPDELVITAPFRFERVAPADGAASTP
jgi:protein TonB